MSPFDLIKIMIESPNEYSKVTSKDKKKNFFIINRRLSISFPFQAQALQHMRINDIAVIDFWQLFLSKQYNKVPYWLYIKGVKKSKEIIEKNNNIKEADLVSYATFFNYDIKSVREVASIYPEEFLKELNIYKKNYESRIS